MKNDSVDSSRNPLIIVGVGASAGGLEALQELLSNLPETENAVYVIAQHMSPTHKSLMVELLQKQTSKQVLEAKNGAPLLANTIVVTPPNKNIFIVSHSIELKEPASQTILPKPSIDLFFTSLAKQQGSRAVGIILSGTGSDGSIGMKSIKAEGGVTLVQEPNSAKYNGMPLASINDHLVDIIATPKELGEELIGVFDFLNGKAAFKPIQTPKTDLMIILGALKQAYRVDFSDYKMTTINRRIQRRMAALNIYDTGEYVDYLHNNPLEINLLYKDLLIGVTTFFRDPEAFAELEQPLLQRLQNVVTVHEKVRIWVAACATGEEAYSIAILVNELIGRSAMATVQIFATDLDSESIQFARNGIYPESRMRDMRKEYRDRYFEKKGDQFQIVKPLREMLVFSEHDLTRDPPFGKLDLIVCRNLLIYFNQSLQNKVLNTFAFALRNDGLLFLGSSETIGELQTAFSTLSREHRIYLKAYSSSSHIQQSTAHANANRPALQFDSSVGKGRRSDDTLHSTMLDGIASHFLPLSLLINETMNIVYSRKKNPYITLSAGSASLQITKMVPPELELELRTAIHQALKLNTPQQTGFTQVTLFDSYTRLVRIVVIPVALQQNHSRLLLISFQEEEPTLLGRVVQIQTEEDENPYIRQLQLELAQTKAQLQAVIEELETSNEELQATNEELQSTNEELQSTNEELETTNEELQATNEEIQVAYNEQQFLSQEREKHRVNADEAIEQMERERTLLKGIADSSTSGIMAFKAIRDEEFSIIDFEWTFVNRSGLKIVGKKEEELLGRRLLIEMPGNREDGLFAIYQEVTNSRKSVEREFFYEHEGLRHWFHQIVVPYLDGFVVTFSDISQRKRDEESIQQHKQRLQLATEAGQTGIWEYNLLTKKLIWDEMMCKLYHVDSKTPKTFEWWQSMLHPHDLDRLNEQLQQTIESGSPLDTTFRIVLADNSERFLNAKATVLYDEQGRAVTMIGSNIDVTQQVESTQLLIDAREIAEDANRLKSDFIANMSHELRTPLHAILSFTDLALKRFDNIDGDKLKRYLQNIETSSKRLLRFLNDLLDISKLETEHLELDQQWHNPVLLLQQVVTEMEALARPKEVEIVFTACTTNVEIYIDFNRIIQALVNVVNNAIKFSPSQSRIEISSGISLLHGESVPKKAKQQSGFWIRVADEGSGIAADDLEKVFQRFYQCGSKKSFTVGAGIGLAISYELMQLHDGTIWAENGSEKGAIFTIWLPQQRWRLLH